MSCCDVPGRRRLCNPEEEGQTVEGIRAAELGRNQPCVEGGPPCVEGGQPCVGGDQPCVGEEVHNNPGAPRKSWASVEMSKVCAGHCEEEEGRPAGRGGQEPGHIGGDDDAGRDRDRKGGIRRGRVASLAAASRGFQRSDRSGPIPCPCALPFRTLMRCFPDQAASPSKRGGGPWRLSQFDGYAAESAGAGRSTGPWPIATCV